MSNNRYNGPLECKVYVGNLGSQGSKGELERVFGYYGPLKNVWVARNPPGFAFVEFEDNRDAEDAVCALDGRTICGVRARVELSTGMTRRGGQSGRSDRGGWGGERRYDGGGRRRRSRSRSPRRKYSRSRSRSRDRYRRSRSYSPYDKRKRDSHSVSRSRSGSPGHRSPSHSPVSDTHRSRSRSSER